MSQQLQNYEVSPPGSGETLVVAPHVYPQEAAEALGTAVVAGNCLVTGRANIGKTQLLSEVHNIARLSEVPVMWLDANSASNVDDIHTAMDNIAAFTDAYGNDGLLIVDNIDNYGLRPSRNNMLADAKNNIAELITDLVADDEGPKVCASAKDFSLRSRDESMQELLGVFNRQSFGANAHSVFFSKQVQVLN